MYSVNTEVFLFGRFDSEKPIEKSGLDDLVQLKNLPTDYSGGIWTDNIEIMGPAFKRTKQPHDSWPLQQCKR